MGSAEGMRAGVHETQVHRQWRSNHVTWTRNRSGAVHNVTVGMCEQYSVAERLRASNWRRCGIHDMSTTACHVECGSSVFAASVKRSL